MEDIAPILLKQIEELYKKEKNSSEKVKRILEKIKEGKISYIDAGEYADELGKILSVAYGSVFTMETLPDGKLYYNIAKRTVEPTMKGLHSDIADITDEVQSVLNKQAGLGIKPIRPTLEQDKIDGIVDRLSNTEIFDDIKWILEEPIKTFARSVVDDAVEANAEFHWDSGMTPKIVRKMAGNCCDWCKKVAGTYIYPDVPQDVYRRHNRCQCSVDYVVGKYQKNVHNNNTGVRRYVKDKYGTYELSKEARIERSKQMAATQKEREAEARRKRIETWKKKKQNAT